MGSKDAWAAARRDAAQPGRPRNSEDARDHHSNARAASSNAAPPGDLADPREACKQYRTQSVAVLLTYNGVADIAKLSRFVKQVPTHLKAWRVKHWCATLEANKEGELYIHLMWQ